MLAILLVGQLLYSVIGELQAPQNVRMEAVNMQYILKWDWDHRLLNYTVNFTAEYLFGDRRKSKIYKNDCYRIVETQCDFSHYFDYNLMYYVRVRTEGIDEVSPWQELQFCPDENAELGPPSAFGVQSRNTMLIVNITHPLTLDKSMSNIISLHYWLEYWKRLSPAQIHTLQLNRSYAILSQLEPWMVYCLRVRVFNTQYNKQSRFTESKCVETEGDGHTPIWQLPVLFLIVGIVILLFSYATYKAYSCMRHLCPPYEIPDSLQGFMSSGPQVLILLGDRREPFGELMQVIPVETTLPLHHMEQRDLNTEQGESDSGISSGQEGSDGSLRSTIAEQGENSCRL
uniref:Interferon alpha/beta receptor 1a-like n=1 Tax=Lepisosteus oculatus TaxID=7918 RepID=W5M993_LEPOC|nr:PREDICTED: interferon alpha/beta receptor 1a-like [Lepisosteus oculatus]